MPAMAGYTPLAGSNVSRLGPRFVPMEGAYDRELRDLAVNVGRELDETVRTGVYCAVYGPCFETAAESRFFRVIGADAAGMSTVHEATTARHCGLRRVLTVRIMFERIFRVLGISLITNVFSDGSDATTSHDEVLEVGKNRTGKMVKYVMEIIRQVFWFIKDYI